MNLFTFTTHPPSYSHLSTCDRMHLLCAYRGCQWFTVVGSIPTQPHFHLYFACLFCLVPLSFTLSSFPYHQVSYDLSSSNSSHKCTSSLLIEFLCRVRL